MSLWHKIFGFNPTLEIEVVVISETPKAIKIRSPIGQTAWIPRQWLIKKREIEPGRWLIKISEYNWVQKFS